MGREDAANGVDHESHLPRLPRVHHLHQRTVAGLADVQDAETADARRAIRDEERRGRVLRDWVPSDLVPAGIRVQIPPSVVVLLGVAVVLLGVEAVVLVAPLDELLQAGNGYSKIAVGVAVFMTCAAGWIAHQRGHEIEQAKFARVPRERDRHVTRANLATIGLLMECGFAFLARVYTSGLETGSYFTFGTVSFGLLQGVFFVAAILCPTAILDLRRHAAEAAVKSAIDVSDGALQTAQANLADLGPIHQRQHDQLDNAAAEAGRAYLIAFADAHPSSFIADQVRRRTPELLQSAQSLPMPSGSDRDDPSVDPEESTGAPASGPRAPAGGSGAPADAASPDRTEDPPTCVLPAPHGGPEGVPSGPGVGPVGVSHPPAAPEDRAGAFDSPPEVEWSGYASPEELMRDLLNLDERMVS
jgi:hypothetical protein